MTSATTPILLVDDSDLNRGLLARALAMAGFEVLECEDGPSALTIVETGRPMLMVLDYDMPDLTGAEVCERVRGNQDPDIAMMPIIMLTGDAGEEREVECLKAGADDFVTKPVNTLILSARIETQLRLHTLRAQLREQNAELERWRRRHELDLAAAQLTQQAILPARPPTIEGWQIASHYQPLIQVGGDIYDWVRLPNGDWVIWIADATGHGAAAALLTTLTKLVFLHASNESFSAAQILDAVNADVYEVFKGRSYLTAGCLVLRPGREEIFFAGAGHPPLLILRNDGTVEQIASRSPPLGVMANLGAMESSTRIAKGEGILLYTDGLYSMKDRSDQWLTPSDAADFLPRHSSSARDLIQRTLAAVLKTANGTPLPDDLAAIAVYRPANPDL
ncbi:MAG: SpoIIE family protein phosphatase [Verrucomicrobiota bacterium]